MTRERSTCATIVQLLRNDNQIDVAERLNRFNISPGPMGLVLEVYLPVNPSTAPKKDLSNCYDLIGKTRGLCVIINNVEKPQTPDVYDWRGLLVHCPKGLQNETKRFKSIFEQLFFDVHVLTQLSALQIEEQLIKIREEKLDKKHQAFVLIAISHGENENLLGFNACEASRKIRFGLIRKDNEEALQEMATDVIGIKKLVEIFSEEKCEQLKSKPKLYFNICCRVKTSKDSGIKSKFHIN